jgi:diguanylate cyclase
MVPAERAIGVSVCKGSAVAKAAPGDARDEASRRGQTLVIWAALGLFGAYLAWHLVGWGGSTHRSLVGDSLFVGADLLAVSGTLMAAARCRSDVRRFRSWCLVSLGMGGYLIGGLLQLQRQAIHHFRDMPDWSDLVFYLFFFVGLVGFAATRRTTVRRWLFTFDMVTIALSAGAVLWYFVAGPAATARGHSVHEVVYSIVYPVGDLVLLLATVRTLQRGVAPSSRRPIRVLALGITTYVVGDTVVGYLALHGGYGAGSWFDLPAMLAVTLFAIAGGLQSSAKSEESTAIARRAGSYWAAYVGAAVVFGLVFVVQRHDPFFPDRSIAGVAFLMAVLVATSQLLGRRALVSEHERNEELVRDLRFQAFHDNLTGVANRALFGVRLYHALARRRPALANHAVLMIDLDGFKAVNDTFGHEAGDELLRVVATRLSSALRRGDTVARVGGDEFAILLEDVSSIRAVLELVTQLLEVIGQPVPVGVHSLAPAASVGIAITGDEEDTADDLLRFADAAMYRAKHDGSTHFCLFEPAMQRALTERLQLEGDLRGAAERGELRVLYQPILALSSGRVTGFEALVRWHHPTRGLLTPDVFVPVAEECGLIHEIDTWVLRRACTEVKRWNLENEGDPISVHVNLSPLQLQEPDLVASVAAALAAADLEPELLILELLETSVLSDLDLARQRLGEVKGLGVRIAMDDFGTGYSSVTHLRQLPIDILKIDRSFIGELSFSSQSRTLVRILIRLAAALDIESVAEGIEDTEQLVHLRHERCSFGQGYLFARPLEADDALDYLRGQAPIEQPALMEVGYR